MNDAKATLRGWQAIAERRRSGTVEVDYVALRNGADEIERLRTLLGTPPTWLCSDCRDQWLMRDAAEKEGVL